MAIYHEDIVDIELNNGSIHRSFLSHTIGAGDALANRFGVRVFRNGAAEDIGGTCMGLFVRADGTTVTIASGTVSGNMAYVTLPEACYAVEGQFALAIKCQGSGVTGTLRIVDGVVSRTSTDALVDPGTVITGIEELIAMIGTAIESIPEDYSALQADVKDIAGNNVVFRDSYKKITTNKGTWANVVETYPLYPNAASIRVKYTTVATDSGTIPTNRIRVDFMSGSTSISYSYITVDSAVLTVPDNADSIKVTYYTNNGTEDNTWIEYTGLQITQNSSDVITKLKDSLILGGYTIEEVSDMLETLEPVEENVSQSKNLFTSHFARGTINESTGVYGPTPTGLHNSGTPDLIEVQPSMGYVLSWKWNPNITSLYLYEYAADESFIGRTTIDSYVKRIGYREFTTGSTTKYVRFLIYEPNNETYDVIVPQEVQLEIGGVPTPKMATKDISPLVDYDKVRDYRLVPPDYYFAGGYLQNKVAAIRQLMFNAAGQYDAFIFVTDTHWEINQQRSPALIHYLKRALNINTLIHGGDVYDKWSQYYHDDALRQYEKAFGSYPYCVDGNHEYKGDYMDDPQIWYFLNSPHKDIIPGNPARNYYYFDNPTTKMRYVVLNVYEASSDDAAPVFEQAQQTWLQSVALDVETGWKIVIITHVLYEILGSQRALFPITGVTSVIENIVDNYSGNGEIVCIIQGHTHIDRMTATPGGIPVIITTCDKNTPWIEPGTDFSDLGYVTRDTGTIAEQAFDVFVIDYKNRLISAVRIGSQAFNGTGDNIGTQVEMRQVPFND